MNLKWVLLLFVAMLLPSVFASDLILEAPSQDFLLKEQTSLNAVFKVLNDSNQSVCWQADATSNSNALVLTVASENFCLNAGEQTQLTVTLVASDNAASGFFDVNLTLNHSLGTDSNSVHVGINQAPVISFTADLESEYCNTENILSSVTVKNNSNSVQTVELDAEALGFAPSLEDFEIVLQPNQQRELDLFIPVNSPNSQGTFELELFALTANQYSVEKFSFNVVKCDFEPETTAGFEFDVPSNCSFVAPGKTRFLNVNIENAGNTPLSMTVSVGSSPFLFELDEDERHFVLDAKGDSQSVGIEFQIPFDAVEKQYRIPVFASSLFSTQTESVCLIVAKPFSVEVFPTEISTTAGNSFGVAVTLQNNWNVSQTVALSNSPLSNGLTVSFSRSSVSLAAFEQKTVLATVQTASTLSLGTHALYLKASNSNDSQTQMVSVTVLPPGVTPPSDEPVSQNVLEFYSFPKQIRLNAGEQKELGFVLHNPSNQAFSNIEIVFQNLPSGVLFVSPTRFDLDVNQTVTLRGYLIAESDLSLTGIRNVSLVARNSQTQTIENVQLELIGVPVQVEPQNPIDVIIVGLSGFFGLAGNNPGIGLLVLAIVVLWLLFDKNPLWTLFWIVVLVIAWFLLGGNWFWFAVAVIAVLILALAVRFTKNHAQFSNRPWRTLFR